MRKRRGVLLTALILGICINPKPIRAFVQTENRQADKEEFIHTETFSATHSMVGLFSECTEYFSAGDWEIKESVLNIVYNVTQLRDDDISDFTVSLNGEPFYSQRVTDSRGEKQTSEITIPADKIKEGVNELKVESYIRTYESLPCADDVSKANWLNISEDSAVSISYYPRAHTDSIAAAYEQLTAIDALENDQSVLIIPDTPSDTELTAAANILAGIAGNASIDYQKLAMERAGNVFDPTASNTYAWGIYVGELYQLPTAVYDALTEEARKAATEGAVLANASVMGKSVLVLTGTDEKLLVKAGVMLGNKEYMAQMTGNVHAVTEDESVVMEKTEQEDYLLLTKEGAYLNGAFRQSTSFSISSVANKTLSPASEIYLKIRYSENLDFERSLMTVYINDIPVGSHKLSRDKANSDEAEFFIPAEMEINGDFVVRVAFDLEIEDVWCTLRQEENPWAYVSEESRMKLVLADDTPLLFENYPSPFIKNGTLNEVAAILPEKPSAADLQTLRGVCLTLGRYQKNNAGSLTVYQGADTEQLRDKNLVVIGTGHSNNLVKEMNDRLYFRFDEEGRILGNEKLAIAREAGEVMGTVQLLPSPYSSSNAVLIVSGASEEGMLQAASYLSDTDELWKITGDGYVAGEDTVSAFQFKETKKNTAETVQTLLDREDVMRFVVISSSVAAILLLGLILILAKHFKAAGRSRRRKRIQKEGEGDEEA